MSPIFISVSIYIYIKLKSITSKLRDTSACVAFIKKALFVDVIPKFAVVKGQLSMKRIFNSITQVNEKSNNQACSRSLQIINTI